MSGRSLSAALLALLIAGVTAPAHAGVVNPDISVLGQPLVRWTNDLLDPSPKRAVLDQGEVETVFDAYLNPYAKGYFVMSLTSDGIALEEGYFTLVRGLPGDLQIKGGKYRVNFGKLNAMHYEQQHLISRRLGNSASTPETSPAFLRTIVNRIQDAAESLRPYYSQEV
jgi:hypothetical protein